MSRILIVTAHYHPFIHPRAHRWTALAEYWAAAGHTVHVVTGRQRGYPRTSEQAGVVVHRTGFSALKELFYYYTRDKTGRGRVGAPVGKPGWMGRLLVLLYNRIWRKCWFPDDACIWYLPARRKTLQLLDGGAFDVMITVALPFTSHLVGLAVKRRYPALRWIADTGDPFSVQYMALNNRFLYGRLSRRLERLVLVRADVTTVTTQGTIDKYRQVFGPAAGRLVVIPPLLHPPPEMAPARLEGRDGLLKLAYFGALYKPMRTPDALLSLLRRVLELRPDLTSRLEVHFYGEIFPEFYDALTAVPVVRLHGLQSREIVRQAMQDADVLISIGNRSDFQLPSKAVEYLASGKPVLHLSYAEQDCWVEFWGDAPGLYVVRVDGGKIMDNIVLATLTWLAGNPLKMNDANIQNRIRTYLIESIARQYEIV
jgi:glycosyltransferase involved in cell wall biosynthesis